MPVPNNLPDEFLRAKKYDIGGAITQDATGSVLNAREATTARNVAMKVLPDSASPDEVSHFVEEARVTSKLEHPGIVPIYELGADAHGKVFCTMKSMQGVTLAKVLELLADEQEEPLKEYPLDRLLTIFQKVCDALAFAHSKGVIHRDLKPDDIMIGDYGEVTVTDWASAKQAAASQESGTAHPSAADSRPLNSASTMRAPQYMSPERARGEVDSLDARSDIYTLGAILYHVLALRPPVEGNDTAAVVGRVAEGRTDPLDAAQKRPHLPGGHVPDSLAAIIRKAMALAPADRYPRVEALQADLTTYQNGAVTEAEKASRVRQFGLLLQRHKFMTGVALLIIAGSLVFGTAAILESLHAKREAGRAIQSMADLKNKAPAFLKLAESEADVRQFDSALGNIDAALALDATLPRAYWQRAWVLLGMQRWADAANALRLAQQHDPSGAKFARILPAVEKMGAPASDAQRWKSDTAREVFAYLQSVDAIGPALVFADKLTLNAEQRRSLTDRRLLAVVGKGNYTASVDAEGVVSATIAGQPLRSLLPIRGVPFDRLDAGNTAITDLEPLRGMRLQAVTLTNTKVSDLTPLRGMPLRSVDISKTPVRDLAPLAGMPLVTLDASNTNIYDLSPLKGAPLKELHVRGCKKLASFSPVLTLGSLERLSCDLFPKELVALRPKLQTIEADAYAGEGFQGTRPAAAFWAAYDAHQTSGAR